MAELNAVVLNAGSGNASSGLLDTSRIDNLFLQVSVSVTAATLSASLTFSAGVAPAAGPTLLAIPSGLTLVAPNALPTGFTAPTTGGVLAISNPGIGTHEFIYKMAAPMPLHMINYTFTSGGGTVSVVVRAYGWRYAT